MSKKHTAENARAHADHLNKSGLQNERLVNKWNRIARKLDKKEKLSVDN